MVSVSAIFFIVQQATMFASSIEEQAINNLALAASIFSSAAISPPSPSEILISRLLNFSSSFGLSDKIVTLCC